MSGAPAAPPLPAPDSKWLKKIAIGLLGASVGTIYLASKALPLPWAIAGGLGIAAVAIVSAVLAERVVRRRAAAFAEVARQQGWTHLAGLGKEDPVVHDVAGCKPFSHGHSQRAEQRLSGNRDGVAFHILDGRYTTGSGRSSRRHAVAAVAVGMPFHLVLTIEAETLGHKVVDALGGEDIDVESDEFSRRFWVKSRDRRTAYDVLHPRAIEFLLGLGPSWTWHWNGPFLVMSREGRLKPQDCLPLLEQALAFRALLPRHLRARSS
jgi:hypothetical protein